MDDQREVRSTKPRNEPRTNRHNDTSRNTGRSGRQNATTRRNMRRDERVTVQGPVKEQQTRRNVARGDGVTWGGRWRTTRTTRGGEVQWGLTHTETRRGRGWTTGTRRGLGSKTPRTTPATTSTTPSPPTTGLRQRGNDATRNTGRSARLKAVTRRSTRREERVTVQGPVEGPKPDSTGRKHVDSSAGHGLKCAGTMSLGMSLYTTAKYTRPIICTEATTLRFASDLSPIFHPISTECHTRGGLAPFGGLMPKSSPSWPLSHSETQLRLRDSPKCLGDVAVRGCTWAPP